MIISPFILWLSAVPGYWVNASIICFCIQLVRQEGLVFSPSRVFRLYWPLFRGMLIAMAGFALGFGLGALGSPSASSVLGAACAMPGAWICDRAVMERASDIWPWRMTILTIVLGFLALGLIPLLLNG